MTLTSDLSCIDQRRLLEFLRTTVWQSEIGPKTLDRALQNSLCMAAIVDGELVGFARAVTDRATFCWVDDLFVDPKHRGHGIARTMMNAIVNHEELATVATWFLASSNPEARKIFEEFGFETLPEDRASKIMALPRLLNERYRS